MTQISTSPSSQKPQKISTKRIKYIIHELGRDKLKALLQTNHYFATTERQWLLGGNTEKSQENLAMSKNSLRPHIEFLQRLQLRHVQLSQVQQHFAQYTSDGTFLMPKYENAIENLAPTHVFSVHYEDDEAWYAQNSVQLGFHGTHFSNVLSILTTGLSPHVKNEARKHLLHGKAVYLAKDLRVARDFSKHLMFRKGNETSFVSVVFIVEYNTDHARRAEDYIMLESSKLGRVRGILWYEVKQKPWSALHMWLFGLTALVVVVVIVKQLYF